MSVFILHSPFFSSLLYQNFFRTLSLKTFSEPFFSQKRSLFKGFKLYEKNNNSFVLCLYFIAIFVHRTHEFPFFSFTRPFRKVPARLGFSFVFSDLFHGNHELTLGFQTSLTSYLPVRPVWYQEGLFFLLFSLTLSMFITSLSWALKR